MIKTIPLRLEDFPADWDVAILDRKEEIERLGANSSLRINYMGNFGTESIKITRRKGKK